MKIKKNIPIPNKIHPITVLMKKMEVGDAFLNDSLTSRDAMYEFAKRCGIKISIRKTNGCRFRVWRIK